MGREEDSYWRQLDEMTVSFGRICPERHKGVPHVAHEEVIRGYDSGCDAAEAVEPFGALHGGGDCVDLLFFSNFPLIPVETVMTPWTWEV
jgi:hypothetical protein